MTDQTRVERILGVRLADDAMRKWPQSGEVIKGTARIGEVSRTSQGGESVWGAADALVVD